jgi:hypothetical protein
MITVILVNVVGVTIYVAGVGMCMRAARRTGNHGYLLVAAYFAAALVVGSLNQVREFERGPVPPEDLYAAPEFPDSTDKEDSAKNKADGATVGGVGESLREEAEGTTKVAGNDVVPEAAKETSAETTKAEQARPNEPPEAEKKPSTDEQSLLTVSPPILPALLLAGVFLISRDDPRKRECEPIEGEAETATSGDEPEQA